MNFRWKTRWKSKTPKSRSQVRANGASRRQQRSSHSRAPISPPYCGSESGVAAVHNKILLYGFWCGCLRPYLRHASTGTGRDFLAISHRCGFGCDLSVYNSGEMHVVVMEIPTVIEGLRMWVWLRVLEVLGLMVRGFEIEHKNHVTTWFQNCIRSPNDLKCILLLQIIFKKR